MKYMKLGIIAVVIAALAITVAVVGAQPPANNGTGSGGRGRGRAMQLQVVADTLGIDLQTLQSDLQAGQTISDIASAQSVELSKIVDAVVAQRTTTLTQAITDGTLTQEQADAQIALLKANLNVELTQSFTATQPSGSQTAPQQPPQGDPRQQQTDQLTTIATALGIDVTTLQSDLQAGQTIADIATAQKVELSTVIDAVVAQRTSVLTQAVTAGTLTQEQADAQILVLKADLNARVTQQWNANRPAGMGDNGGMMGPHGNGVPGRNPPNGTDNAVPGGNPPTGGSAPASTGSNA